MCFRSGTGQISKESEGSAQGSSCRCRDQASQARQVVSRGGEGEDPVDLRQSSMFQLKEPSRSFDPSEGVLDALPGDLTDPIAGEACGARIDGTAPTGRVLRDVGRQSLLA